MTNQEFKAKVWRFFHRQGRDLPWRHTHDPYKILVSEIMLQQTQVDRVIPKYRAWLKLFPNPHALATAPLARVLTAWQGLGYNRRAIALQRAAKSIVEAKKFPESHEEILALPGVGPYTASAILAFAFNKPGVMIETNIRTVFIHHFFAQKKNEKVHDAELLPFIEKAVSRKNPREWYWALMDYGAHLKKKVGNASRRSAHYTRQSRFAGSNRQLRGAVLRHVGKKPLTSSKLLQELTEAGLAPSPASLESVLSSLRTEGFIARSNNKIILAS